MAIKVSGTTVIDSGRNADVTALNIGGTTVIDSGRNADVTSLSIGGTAVTATPTEINYLSGVTSNLQTQLDNITVTAATLTKSFASGETSSISLSSALSPAPVVSVTKEVPQVGIVSKGSWDVATNGANYDRLDSAYDTTLAFYSYGWDVSTASFVQSFSVSGQDGTPQGIFFKPDGTKMYVVGSGGDSVNEYNLTTAWDVSTASYSQNFSVSTQETTPTGIFFKPDGTKMYITGDVGNDVGEYNLSTAWDVSTSVYNQSLEVSAQEISPSDVFFKPDGLKMYIVGSSGDDVNEYDLSTAWDISTASFLQNFSVAGLETIPQGVFFRPDGTKMYVIGYGSDNVNEYNLSTAWDISTASFNQLFTPAQDAAPYSVFFKPDGTKMYITGGVGVAVYEFDLDLNNALTLGSGSFAASDVGKTIEGNGGEVVLTAADGSYTEVTAFTDSSTIAAGDWGMYGAVFDATNGLELSIDVKNNWNISTASFVQSFVVSGQEGLPTGVSFKPDGTKMYVIGWSGDEVDEYDLTTAWDISTASYLQSFSVSAQDSLPHGLFFKDDGTEMYMAGDSTNTVYHYSLSTAWDVSTASLTSQYPVSTQEQGIRGIFLKPDGTKMYITGENSDEVNEYNLSTAWRAGSATFSQDFSVSAQESVPEGIFFKPDGLKMYILGSTGDDVNEYSLTTAWDISTASYSHNFSVAGQTSSPGGLFIKPDGTKMYVIKSQLYEYNIGSIAAPTNQYTPSITNAGGQINSAFWLDINGMTTDEAAGDGNVYYAVSTDDRTTWSVIKDADGVRPIVRDNAGTWEYNTAFSLVDNWDVSTASFLQSFSISAQESAPEDISFKPDGTKMYVIGQSGDDVNEYDLSTAWDVSTASFLQSFSVASQETFPTGMFFKPDGTKMYITGIQGDDLNEYDLSTAWDVSTAVYSQTFDVSGQESAPRSVFFKPDGTKMYITGTNERFLNEYDLSTAWDISTASFLQNFNVSTQEATPYDVFFKPDGLKMYIIGETGDDVNEYNLSTAWDISTTVFSQNFSISAQEAAPRGVSFKPDGAKMYVIGSSGDDVNEYNVGSVGYTTSTTWTSATTNSELYALQQALTEVAPNRMDKAQLEAVTDPNHYTLGDSLDLMIGLYLGSASSDVPSSDGVSINYDAESLNQGAILGTDYDYDFPNSTTVRVTSNAAQNLKVRVV